MKIYRPNGSVLIDVVLERDSYIEEAVMSSPRLVLSFVLGEYLEIPLMSYAEWRGERYILFRPSDITKQSNREYIYTVSFYGYSEMLKGLRYKLITDAPRAIKVKFPLVGKPSLFIELLVKNLNEVDEGWSVGDVLEATERTIAFNHEDCFSALGRLAEEFNTEWYIEDKRISLGRLSKYQSEPIPLSYGKGKGLKPGIEIHQEGDKLPIGRLYVQGGDKNIDPSKYGSQTLLLPKNSRITYEGRTYHTDALGTFVETPLENAHLEASYDATEIYPKRVGTVSRVETINKRGEDGTTYLDYDIIDSSIPEGLNYRQCTIAGEKAFITFQSGRLAGQSFDIESSTDVLLGYIHSERRFRLVRRERDGYMMPEPQTFYPSEGDTYAVFGIHLPDAYISDDRTRTGASWDMLREAVRYMHRESEPKTSYTAELDGIYAQAHWAEIGYRLVLGSHIRLVDTPMGVDRVIRITSIRTDLNRPYKPKITLSNADVSASIISSLAKLEAEEVIRKQEVDRLKENLSRGWADAIKTSKAIEKVFGEKFNKEIAPLAIRTMQLLAGDESLQFAFVESQTSTERVRHLVSYDTDRNILHLSAGIIRHYTLGINTITSVHKLEEYRHWRVSALDYAVRDDLGTLYIYIKCNKDDDRAQFVVSETTKEPIEESFYNLFLGILSTNPRVFTPLYGFTEVLPGRITTGRITSADGRTYFDLDEGEIGGNIKFRGFDNQSRTEVSGGLLLTEALLLRDKDGKVRAMLNGRERIRGTYAPKGIVFAAGITDFATEREHRVIEIKHSGDARFGLMNIEQTPMGSVITYLDPNTESVGPLLRIGGSQTPLSDLIDRSGKTSSIRVPEQTITMSQTAQAYQGGRENARKTIESSERVVVPKTGKARIRCRIELELDVVRIPPEAPHAYSSVEIGIGGGIYRTSQFIRSWDTNGDRLKPFDRRKTFEIDETIDNIPAGTYSVSVTAILAVYGQDHSVAGRSYASLTARIGAIQVDILSVDTSVREVVFGSEGLSAFFGHNRFVYLSRHPDLPVLSARGRVNLPGVILSGYVATDRVIRTEGKNRHYALRQLYNPLGLNVVCYDFGSDGYFCITHNAGFEGLLPQITVVGGSDYASMLTTAVVKHISEISFQIWVANNDRGMQRQDFIFTLIGTNY